MLGLALPALDRVARVPRPRVFDDMPRTLPRRNLGGGGYPGFLNLALRDARGVRLGWVARLPPKSTLD